MIKTAKKKKTKTVLKRKDGKPDGRAKPRTAKFLAVHESPREPREEEGGQPDNTNAKSWTEKDAIELGNQLVDWLMTPGVFISTIAGPMLNKRENPRVYIIDFLHREKQLYPSVTCYLETRFESFSNLMEKARMIQQAKIANYGIMGLTEKAFTCFTMKHLFKWRDKLDIEIKEEKVLTFDITLEEKIKALSPDRLADIAYAEIPEDD